MSYRILACCLVAACSSKVVTVTDDAGADTGADAISTSDVVKFGGEGGSASAIEDAGRAEDVGPDLRQTASYDLIGRPCEVDLDCFNELPQGYCRMGVCSRLCETGDDCCVPGEVCGVCAPAPASGPTARACMRVCKVDTDCWAGDGCIEGRCTDGRDS